MEEKCKTCKYFYVGYVSYDPVEISKGRCRRFPPVLISGIPEDQYEYITSLDGSAVDFFSQPWVLNYDWCGEYKRMEIGVPEWEKKDVSWKCENYK